MTDDQLDDVLSEGFSGLSLAPDRLASMVSEARPRPSPWPRVGLVLAAAATLMMVAWPLLRGDEPAAPAPGGAGAPEVRDVLPVPAGQRALTLELGTDASWSGRVIPGTRVDVLLVVGEQGELEGVTLATDLQVVAVEAGGLVSVAADPAVAERLLQGRERGRLHAAVDLGRGRRGLEVEVDEASVRSGLVSQGGTIDLLLTSQRDGQLQTRTLVEAVTVLAAEPDGRLLVDVSPSQAEALVLAQEVGRLSATLRGR